MTDSLQKIIDDLKDANKHESWLAVSDCIDRIEALQAKPMAWVTEDRVLIKNYFGDKTDRTNLIPLIRAD